jgi:hypothetical protein
MTTIFLLGFFIDFFEIAFIVVPLFAPIAGATLRFRRPGLVRRHRRGQHADFISDATLWLCPVLPAPKPVFLSLKPDRRAIHHPSVLRAD